MKILMVCTMGMGTNKIGQDLGRAFAELGHGVAYYDYDERPLPLRLMPKALRGEGYQRRVAEAQNAALRRAVRNERPRIVFVVKGFLFEPATLEEIRSAGAVLVGMWVDDPLDHARALERAPHYDLYFTNDAATVESYHRHGIARAHHLLASADTSLFHPLGVARDLPIALVGTRTDLREKIVRQLADLPLHVFGPGWTKIRIDGRVRLNPAAFGARTNDIYNRALINLNIHNWLGRGGAMNLRLFEVPAAGAFLLTDPVDEIRDSYVEDRHLACWRGVEELRDKLEHFLARPAECEQIARAGREHFLVHHSYPVRARRVLQLAEPLLK